MAVRAYRELTDGPVTATIEHTFECSTFDLITENEPGIWTEIWRDCDMGTRSRRRLWPYASGLKGTADVDITIPARQRHWKYFQGTNDDFVTDLDMSDINGGVLPGDFCRWMEVYQNGKKLPCRAYTIQHTPPATVLIDGEWTVPGASYEVIFWAAPYGGANSPGT